MLANLNDILKPARKGKYCIGQFNVLTSGMARGVIRAAEEVGMPVVLGIEEGQLPICPLSDFAAFVIPMASKASVPVAVHFDHGWTFKNCVQALKAGFTSVNFDKSLSTLEENEERVAELVHFAHAYDATVEAELGHTPDVKDDDGKMVYASPGAAAEYVEKTGVDALAIAIGTAHGEYSRQPDLDFDRIRAVSAAVDLPLVIHGGSGLSDRAVRTAIDAGISKIDIFTDINLACFQGDIQAMNDGIRMKSEAIPYETHAVAVSAEEKIRLYAENLLSKAEHPTCI
ncbi:MAG: class II fructose-bisphosphate aldolase [Lachnospiraceae bacterium]|nr:class II fructose-bisphosphate aldolase [Lachnospiraceae bacterium]